MGSLAKGLREPSCELDVFAIRGRRQLRLKRTSRLIFDLVVKMPWAA